MPHFPHLEKKEYTDLYCNSIVTGKLNFFKLYSTFCDKHHTNTHYK